MNKLERLQKLKKLIKLQEQDILAEFKNSQLIKDSIKNQIDDLSQHSATCATELMSKPVVISEINLVRSFNQNIELVIEQLNTQLGESDKNLYVIAEKMKEVRTRMKSIERLEYREQEQKNFEQQKYTQQQLDENINYSASTRND